MAADVRTGAGCCRHLLLAAAAAFCAHHAAATAAAEKYLIVSSPGFSTIAYLKLGNTGAPAIAGTAMRTLIDSGLKYPQGIAVDSYRKKLYVADPSMGKLVRYSIEQVNDAITVKNMETVADGVEVRAVAVDGLGNVFFSDEPNQQILRMTAQMIDAGTTTAEVVYDGSTIDAVSAPGGVALDNYFVYWLNKASGTKVGTVVRALQDPSLVTTNTSIMTLSNNSDKCYGLCLALGNIYYSDESFNLYGVSRSATTFRGPATTVSSAFQEPRGCAYDGESTIYVADKSSNAVYQFAANMKTPLSNRPMAKAADLEGAFGVAVYTKITS